MNEKKSIQASIFGDLEGENKLPEGFQKNFWVYELRHGKKQERRYFGISQNPAKRMKKHLSGSGKMTAWLQEHPENIELVWCYETETDNLRDAEQLENAYVVTAMRFYGVENVRGGNFSQRNIGFVERTLEHRGIVL